MSEDSDKQFERQDHLLAEKRVCWLRNARLRCRVASRSASDVWGMVHSPVHEIYASVWR